MQTATSINLEDKLCFEGNPYLNDVYEHITLWRAILNNGQRVYQDDREGPSWLLLKEYCESNDLYIEEFRISFRNSNHYLPAKKDGYYFIKSAGGIWGLPHTFHYYVIGFLEGGIIHTQRVKIPELIVEENEERTIEQCDEFLIRNRATS